MAFETHGLLFIQRFSDLEFMQDLGRTFNAGVLERMGRVGGDEIRPWLERVWLAASAGIPINPQLKRQLMHELYYCSYEPFHTVGEAIFISDAPNNLAGRKIHKY